MYGFYPVLPNNLSDVNLICSGVIICMLNVSAELEMFFFYTFIYFNIYRKLKIVYTFIYFNIYRKLKIVYHHFSFR